MALPGTAAIPAVHADRLRAAEATGETAVALARSRLTPAQILTPKAIENALRVLLAIGGSTNAIIHLTAVAGRVGVPIDLVALNQLSDDTPVLVDLKPSGQHYMEDFFAAGGVGAVLRELRDRLHLDCVGVTGETLGARLDSDDAWVDRGVIRSAREPFQPVGGLVVAVRLAGPGRGHPQALGGRRPAVRDRGTGGRVRLAGRPGGTDRRSGAGRDARRFPGAEERRPQGRAGDARGRLSADSHQALAGGRDGHGADLGRAHERDRLRHDRAARHAGGGRRRPAGARAVAATASGCRSRSADSICSSIPPSWRAGPPRRAEPTPARGYAGCTPSTCCRPTPAATSTSSAAAEAQGRSNSSASPSGAPASVTPASPLTAAPSPAPTGWPFNVSDPRATCTQAWRPRRQAVRRRLLGAEHGGVHARVLVDGHRSVGRVGRGDEAQPPAACPRRGTPSARSWARCRSWSGRIQIWSRCTRSVGEGLDSLWRTPVPALMRWTSPGRMTEPVPRLSRCSSAPSEHVGDDLHVAMGVGAGSPRPGATRSSLMTRRRAEAHVRAGRSSRRTRTCARCRASRGRRGPVPLPAGSG